MRRPSKVICGSHSKARRILVAKFPEKKSRGYEYKSSPSPARRHGELLGNWRYSASSRTRTYEHPQIL